jgi:hypothetical protein
MDQQRKPAAAPAASTGQRVWQNTFFLLSAVLGGLALLQFDAGHLAHALGDLGASVLMISLIYQYPFVRAVLRAAPKRMSPRARETAAGRTDEAGRAAQGRASVVRHRRTCWLGSARHLARIALYRHGLSRDPLKGNGRPPAAAKPSSAVLGAPEAARDCRLLGRRCTLGPVSCSLSQAAGRAAARH